MFDFLSGAFPKLNVNAAAKTVSAVFEQMLHLKPTSIKIDGTFARVDYQLDGTREGFRICFFNPSKAGDVPYMLCLYGVTCPRPTNMEPISVYNNNQTYCYINASYNKTVGELRFLHTDYCIRNENVESALRYFLQQFFRDQNIAAMQNLSPYIKCIHP